jgi:hypothetical protein
MTDKKRILVLAANPKSEDYAELQLEKEFAEIDAALRRAGLRQQIELIYRSGITSRAFQEAILEDKPDIVHFCGHGEEKGLVLEDKKYVSAEALEILFELLSDSVQCVVLNACHSSEQAVAISQYIDCVIGMNSEIRDRSAIEFSSLFYQAIARGYSFEQAFKLGHNQIRIAADARDIDVPQIYRRLTPSSTPSIWLYAWDKPPQDTIPTALIDWTQYFDKDAKTTPDQKIWDGILIPELRQIKAQLKRFPKIDYIDVQSRSPLTVVLALGNIFPDVGGYHFQVEQRTGNQSSHWRSDETATKLKFNVEEQGQPGENLLVTFSITGSARADVDKLILESGALFSATVYSEPTTGTGRDIITCAGDATALAEDACRVLQSAKKKYCPKVIHLILYAPAGFCLFLGQKLNALGEIVAYERRMDESYLPAIRLRTG